MQSVNYELWMRRELWTLKQAVALVLGLKFSGHNDAILGPKLLTGEVVTKEHMRRFKEIYTQAMDAIDLKDLAEIASRNGPRREPQVRPKDFLAWALDRGIPIPDALNALIGPTKGESLTTKERTTFLVIIGLLANMADIDCTKASKSAGIIVSKANDSGVNISQQTVANYLKASIAALDSRKG